MDISVSGTEPKEERRLFRFERDSYYKEIYLWYLRNGTKYLDGRCGQKELGQAFEDKCREIQWNITEFQDGLEPKFFGEMLGLFYPTVSQILP